MGPQLTLTTNKETPTSHRNNRKRGMDQGVYKTIHKRSSYNIQDKNGGQCYNREPERVERKGYFNRITKLN